MYLLPILNPKLQNIYDAFTKIFDIFGKLFMKLNIYVCIYTLAIISKRANLNMWKIQQIIVSTLR